MIVGTVTRATANAFAPAQQLGDQNRAEYYARNLVGNSNLGFFSSIGDAQQAVANATNQGRPLSWELQTLGNDIEHWVGSNDILDPGEIYGASLLLWAEADAGVFLDPVTGLVNLFGDRAGTFSTPPRVPNNLTQAAAASQPSFLQTAQGGKPTIVFGAADFLATGTAFTLDPTTTSFTVSVVASREVAAGVDRIVNQIVGFGAAGWTIGIDAAGLWEFDNGGVILGPASVLGRATVLQATQNPTSAEAFVDSTSIGTNAVVMAGAATDLQLGDIADPWGGNIPAIVVAADNSAQRRLQVHRYLQRKYNAP